MIEKIMEKIPFEKICEYMPFGWTLHSREVRQGTNPVCYYSFCRKNSCQYIRPRNSRLARFLKQDTKNFRLYECAKKEVKSNGRKKS